MVRHWYRPGYWRWWWSEGAPEGVRPIVIVAAICAVFAGGYFVASSASPRRTPRVALGTTTVVRTHVVTLRANGLDGSFSPPAGGTAGTNADPPSTTGPADPGNSPHESVVTVERTVLQSGGRDRMTGSAAVRTVTVPHTVTRTLRSPTATRVVTTRSDPQRVTVQMTTTRPVTVAVTSTAAGTTVSTGQAARPPQTTTVTRTVVQPQTVTVTTTQRAATITSTVDSTVLTTTTVTAPTTTSTAATTTTTSGSSTTSTGTTTTGATSTTTTTTVGTTTAPPGH